MIGADILRKLHSHQEAILVHLGEAFKLLALPPEQARAPLAEARWQLVRKLRQYQLFKHGEIFDPLIRRGAPAQRQAAELMKRACIDAGEAYCGHVKRWSSSDIVQAWAEYRPAASAITATIETHIKRERTNVMILLRASGADADAVDYRG